MKYPLARNAVFWTLQGEGALQGEPMIFVRLAGCSVGCVNCDTDYVVVRRVEVDQLLEEIQRAVPASFTGLHPWVWLTGGEPTDHNLGPLVDGLRTIGFKVALATAGTRPIPASFVDWLSVSPHSLATVQRVGHELKVVPGLKGLPWSALDEIETWRNFAWRYIQPLWWQTVNRPEHDGAESQKSLEECITYVKTHPGWRLTSQAHKGWDLS